MAFGVFEFLKERFVSLAGIIADEAAGMEGAARAYLGKRRGFAAEDGTRFSGGRVNLRDGGNQGLRIRMQRIVVKFLCGGTFDDLAQIHYGHHVADVFDDRQIVRDEKIRQAEFILQIL